MADLVVRIYFIRHGETDWGLVESRGVRGWAASFAPLTRIGRLQIDTIARDYRLADASAIVSSSYARALESAALLSRALNKPLYVEYDLHEWLPQKDPLGEYDGELLAEAKRTLRLDGAGAPPPGDAPAVPTPWESLDEVRGRVCGVLRRYAHLDPLIVVTHAVVIGSLVGGERFIEHAEIVPFDLDPDAPDPVARVATP